MSFLSVCHYPIMCMHFSCQWLHPDSTHHHLPEISTSWVCRVEQEDIRTGIRGKVSGHRVKTKEERKREQEEEGSALELILYSVQLQYSLLFFTVFDSYTTMNCIKQLLNIVKCLS